MGKQNSEEEKKKHARARSARYYAAQPERVKNSSKKWRDKNREQVNSVSREYAKQNREKYKIHCVSRRTKKAQAGGYFTPEEWFTLCFACGFKCLCCGQVKPLTADHVIPVSKGGPSWLWNIQPLCGPCNSKKGNKVIDFRLGGSGCREKT